MPKKDSGRFSGVLGPQRAEEPATIPRPAQCTHCRLRRTPTTTPGPQTGKTRKKKTLCFVNSLFGVRLGHDLPAGRTSSARELETPQKACAQKNGPPVQQRHPPSSLTIAPFKREDPSSCFTLLRPPFERKSLFRANYRCFSLGAKRRPRRDALINRIAPRQAARNQKQDFKAVVDVEHRRSSSQLRTVLQQRQTSVA
jgi:hypothetical protein